MLSRRTTRRPADDQPPTRATARGLRRCVPVLALGLTALALAVPSSLPAAAAPGGPSGTSGTEAKGSTTKRATKPTATPHLTAAAKQAGLQPGNATMGWHERGTERVATGSHGALSRYGKALTMAQSPGFTPKGVLGLDVSSYQKNIKWSTWAGRDKQFVYIKATEGTSYRNPYFTSQYRGSYKVGMIRGAYHFASPSGKAGYKQARYFIKNGGGGPADGRTLPGVLDIEYNPYGSTCYGLSKKKMVAWISSFTREYRRITGKDAVIYSTTDWWKQCTGNSAAFADTNPLWIARYGTKKPGTLPKGWTTATFWQYSANPIDQDVFPAKLKVLTKLASTKAKGSAS